tara:strand:- start:7 stop:354 length:348 start_codon:yes stop_codon:yes gene_type:complete
MSMHMIRGVQVHGTGKRRKPKHKSKKLRKAEAEHEKFLKQLGVGRSTTKHKNKLPDLSCGPRVTSDNICSNGTKKDAVKYTGNEIAGIVVTHKSNLMPVRKDNKQAAVDAASMRR